MTNDEAIAAFRGEIVAWLRKYARKGLATEKKAWLRKYACKGPDAENRVASYSADKSSFEAANWRLGIECAARAIERGDDKKEGGP